MDNEPFLSVLVFFAMVSSAVDTVVISTLSSECHRSEKCKQARTNGRSSHDPLEGNEMVSPRSGLNVKVIDIQTNSTTTQQQPQTTTHHTTPPAYHNMANSAPATKFDDSKNLSISSEGTSPLYFKWYAFHAGTPRQLYRASFSPNKERAMVHAL